MLDILMHVIYYAINNNNYGGKKMKKISSLKRNSRNEYQTSDGRLWTGAAYHAHDVFEAGDGKAYSELGQHSDEHGWTLRGTGDYVMLRETNESIIAHDPRLTAALEYARQNIPMDFRYHLHNGQLKLNHWDGRRTFKLKKLVGKLTEYKDILTY
jgi:hypothetical protein